MQWEAGDSLEPATYQHLLENVTDVVHTVGMISEMDYKQVAGAKNLCDAANGVARLAGEFIGMRDRGNPLRETPRPTFEMVNRDTSKSLKVVQTKRNKEKLRIAYQLNNIILSSNRGCQRSCQNIFHGGICIYISI